MKTIKYKISKYTSEENGNLVYTYYIDFGQGNGWYYTIRATNEAFRYMSKIWVDAGYTLVLEEIV